MECRLRLDMTLPIFKNANEPFVVSGLVCEQLTDEANVKPAD